MAKRELTDEERAQVDADWPEQEVTKGELVPRGEAGVVRPLATEEVLAFLTNTKAMASTSDDPETAALDIIGRILAAETIEDVDASNTVVHASDVLWEPLTVEGVKWNQSDFDATGPGVYCLMDVVRQDGSRILVTCGGLNVMAQLYRWEQLKAWPLPVHLEEAAKATKAGYKPLWLRLDVERRAVKA